MMPSKDSVEIVNIVETDQRRYTGYHLGILFLPIRVNNGQIILDKHCKSRLECSLRSSLISVYNVCNSTCIFLKNFYLAFKFCVINTTFWVHGFVL